MTDAGRTQWTIADTLCLSAVFLVGAITVLPIRPLIGWDSSWYIIHGLNLLLGNGYTGFDPVPAMPHRGPLLPLMYALAMVPHISSYTANCATLFFALLLPLQLFLLGRSLMSTAAGTTAALFYLASGAASLPHLRAIDPVCTVFLLLALMALPRSPIHAPRRFILAGTALGMGYLVKESMVLFFPLPLLFWAVLPAIRSRALLGWAAAATALATLFPAAWTIYRSAATNTQEVLGVHGASVPQYIVNQLFPNGTFNPQHLLVSGYNVLSSVFISPFALAWTLLPAIVLLVFLSIRQVRFRAVLLPIVCVSPLTLYIGLRQWHPGYNHATYLLGFLVMGLLLGLLLRKVPQGPMRLAAPVAATIFGALLLFMPSDYSEFNLPGLSRAQFLVHKSYLTPAKRRDNVLARDLYPTLKNELDRLPPQNLMVDLPPKGSWIYFNTLGKFHIVEMPRVICHGQFRSQTRYTGPVPLSEPPFAFLSRGTGSNPVVTMMYESIALEQAHKHSCNLFVSFGRPFRPVLGRLPWLSTIRETRRWELFRIDEDAGQGSGIVLGHTRRVANRFADTATSDTPAARALQHTINSCLGADMDRSELQRWLHGIRDQ